MKNEITIICAVAADFVSKAGEKFSITKRDLGMVKPAPAWIQKTKMFDWLAADGSLKFVTPHNKIQAENDPLLGLGADGKQLEATEPPKKPSRGRKSASAKQDEETVTEAPGTAPEGKKEGEDGAEGTEAE